MATRRKNPELEKAIAGLKKPNVFVAVYMRPDQRTALRNMVDEETGGTVSSLVRDIIDDYLGKKK